MENPKLVGLLVRVRGAAGAPLAAAAGAPLRDLGFGPLEELFSVPSIPPATLGAAPSAPAQWLRAAVAPGGPSSPWDAVHAAVGGRLGLAAAGGEVYVEPDIEQVYLSTPPREPGEALAAAGGSGTVTPPDRDLPFREELAWHLLDDFAELGAARAEAGDPGPGKRVRIAHLDVGYDPQHETLPANLLLQAPRNFVDDQPADDATDPGKSHGPLDNPGHGAGTLSILAGNRSSQLGDFLGGAAQCEVVPLRIAKSVVLLGTSALAKALDHVAAGGAGGRRLADVVSLSMGGVASRAWADAVNKCYEAGVVLVAAAGNNFSTGIFGVPTHFIVYPARFRRVIAACGVMANRQPYYNLPIRKMQGNWGPASKMATAIAAFTPNMPWAEHGAAKVVDRDGRGTSSATPQVAAAAALWLTRHRARVAQYAEPWMRVEAVRHALFTSADKSADGGSSEKLGNGVLRARRALAIEPTNSLAKTPRDSATLSLLRVLTGLGMAASASQRIEMFGLEATQLVQQGVSLSEPNPFEGILPDPDLPAEAIPAEQRRRFVEALIDHPRASQALKQHLKQTHEEVFGGRAVGGGAKPGEAAAGAKGAKGAKGRGGKPKPDAAAAAVAARPAPAPVPAPPRSYAGEPPYRSLRGYAIDPSLAQRLDTLPISQVTFSVPWERLDPGPVGEYLEVIDFDPAGCCFYEPIDLDDPKLLAQDGLAPSEGTPQFHQQMVYAVASLTIKNFERALGRKVLWSPGPAPKGEHPKNDSHFVQRLRIYPHALRDANAYYSPAKKALLFGYFPATGDEPGDHLPGGMVFTCLSYDVVAHETTHALLDGMHRRFINPSNPDVLAFHEAFADIVALFQHFSMPEVMRHQIARTRGNIRSQENLLGELAGEFGRATGMREALRSAIGKYDKDEKRWKRKDPDPQEYQDEMEPHLRGAILVAAVFDAFLSIYEKRIAPLLRLATGGSGELPSGAIPPDLVEKLAEAASKSATHVLTMCVRALDYSPPVDITFGEFLRAIITADYDLVRDDDMGYRVAFIEAFRHRGIYPRDLRTLSVESLRWRSPLEDELRPSPQLLSGLEKVRAWSRENEHTSSRETQFQVSRAMRAAMHEWLARHFEQGTAGEADARFLGLSPGRDGTYEFEVHALRVANRVGPDGDLLRQMVLEVLQEREEPVDPADPAGEKIVVEGGCTIIADLQRLAVDYCIRKNVASKNRLARQREFANELGVTSLYATYFGAGSPLGEPVAALHRGGF
jgi:subtilisin family serine protease/quinol monooxygenase YgiN